MQIRQEMAYSVNWLGAKIAENFLGTTVYFLKASFCGLLVRVKMVSAMSFALG